MFNFSLKKLQEKEYIPLLVVLTLFVIPLSLALKSLFIIISTMAILLTPNYRNQLVCAFSQKWSIAAIAFFLVALAACFWGTADYHLRFSYLEKYSKLLYLPILAVGFRARKTRQFGIYAFLVAMTITCFLSLAKIHEDAGAVFHNHIITSYMMVLAAYLAGLLAIQQQGVKRIVFVILACLFTYQIVFVNTGRSGYILYLILLALLLLQNMSLKYMVIVIACVVGLSTVSIYQHSEMSNGLHRTIVEWENYQHGEKDTSLGQRFQFQQFAKALFLSSPWTGQGIAGYKVAVKRTHFFSKRKLDDPHSQYWLIAAEFGLLGLLALLCFFSSLLFFTFKLHEMKPIMLGVLISFLLANLSDSLLLYSAVGNLFIVFSALCFGELIETQTSRIENHEHSPRSLFSPPVKQS